MSEQVETTASLAIGRLEGRLGALELRMSRHEDKIDEKMNSLETKIDGLHTKLDAKVDQILRYQAGRETLLSAAKWVTGVVLALYGWATFWHHY
jgi:hypothetical protein